MDPNRLADYSNTGRAVVRVYGAVKGASLLTSVLKPFIQEYGNHRSVGMGGRTAAQHRASAQQKSPTANPSTIRPPFFRKLLHRRMGSVASGAWASRWSSHRWASSTKGLSSASIGKRSAAANINLKGTSSQRFVGSARATISATLGAIRNARAGVVITARARGSAGVTCPPITTMRRIPASMRRTVSDPARSMLKAAT